MTRTTPEHVAAKIAGSEHRERLEAMTADDAGQTWDFSDNDIAAIEWAIAEIDRLSSENYKLKWSKGIVA